ncbi:MAG: hypothetical protein KGS72_13515 [Cyanobacteria bacterium REEB67]|nr:hypothetical protein [Cyanobacteria bacterium REEB67]
MASLTPAQYLNKTIAVIQKRAWRTTAVNWRSVKAKAAQMITSATSTADTYDAINYVLSELGDNHSFLKNC